SPPFGITKAIPISPGGFQSTNKDSAGPVRSFGDWHFCSRNYASETLVLGDFRTHPICALSICGRAACPQENAMAIRVSRSDPLRIYVTTLLPANVRSRWEGPSPSSNSTERCCQFNERSPADLHVSTWDQSAAALTSNLPFRLRKHASRSKPRL